MAEVAGNVNGTNLLLYIGTGTTYSLVGCATSNGLSMNTETLDASCKGTGNYSAITPGKRSWTMSISGLYTIGGIYKANDLVDFWKNGTLLYAKFGELAQNYFYSGATYITDLSITGDDNANATFDATLTGSGELYKVAGS